jgi:hypothetical protein
MRHVYAGIAIAIFIGASVAHSAPAPKGKTHTEAQSYSTPNGVRTSHADENDGIDNPEVGGLVFTPRRGDRSVRVEVRDAVAENVIVYVTQAPKGAGEARTQQFCGSIEELPLASAKPVTIHVHSGICINHNWSTPTTGTITTTFSTLPVGSVATEHHHH